MQFMVSETPTGRPIAPRSLTTRGSLLALVAALTTMTSLACVPARPPALPPPPAPLWLIGDSRCFVDSRRIDSELEKVTQRPVTVDCRRGATAANHPLALSPPPAGIIVFMFGPNEVASVRNAGTRAEEIRRSWQTASDKAIGRVLWVTQQADTWIIQSGGTPLGRYTRNIATDLNRFVRTRWPVAEWGPTADENVRTSWPHVETSWFRPEANDPQHPRPGGWGPIALALVIGHAVNARS